LYALSGVFIVAPDERALCCVSAAWWRGRPRPGYHLPWPVEQVIKPAVTQIRKAEFGFRRSGRPPARYQDVDPEALMLTATRTSSSCSSSCNSSKDRSDRRHGFPVQRA